MPHDPSEPFPPPPKAPSTEPHLGHDPAMLLAQLHGKVDEALALIRELVNERIVAGAIERRQDEALALIERRLAIAGIPEAPESNGHANG